MTTDVLPAQEKTAQVPPGLTLDLTRRCTASCLHCYNASSPSGSDGEMTLPDWLSALEEAAAAGVRHVQFIGGEPMLYRGLDQLVTRAVEHGLGVEVFSALMFVPKRMWPVLQLPGVTLATSYYSDRAEEHEALTRNRGSYQRTRANIRRALAHGIPLRAGVIQVREGQRVKQAAAELRELGVAQIGFDRVRALGRAAGEESAADPADALCGHCTRGRAAILPSGEVTGCPMSLEVGSGGNLRENSLRDIVNGPRWQALSAAIPPPSAGGACYPKQDTCTPSSQSGVDVVRGFFAHADSSCYPKQDTCTPSSQSGTAPLDTLQRTGGA